jgi:glutamine amidotransferase
MMRAVAVIDYGMGNLRSVANAIEFLGYRATIAADPKSVESAEAIILPGVGAFGMAMDQLRNRGLVAPLTEKVVAGGTPFLGICLGMQLVAKSSTEGGLYQGLGWIDAEVHRIRVPSGSRLPHVGWNDVRYTKGDTLFAGVRPTTSFFFDHSYTMQCVTDEPIVAVTSYAGVPLTAAVRRRNIFATQFHPEKSQINGLRVFRNFLNYIEAVSVGVPTCLSPA